jgi:hypothetical protein
MKIAFLLHHAHSADDTTRTDPNLAATPAEQGHKVEIAPAPRRRNRPTFDDPRIRTVSLADFREVADPSEARLAAGSQARKKAEGLGRGYS